MCWWRRGAATERLPNETRHHVARAEREGDWRMIRLTTSMGMVPAREERGEDMAGGEKDERGKEGRLGSELGAKMRKG